MKINKIFWLFANFFLVTYIIGGCFYFLAKVSPKLILNHSYNIIMLDKDNNVIYQQQHNSESEYIAIEEMPQSLLDAFIATEDKNFYSHSGIDMTRTFAAMLNNIKSQRLEQGGSTISQQLARTLFLDTSKSITRKIQEAFTSVRIETDYSKKEILELYLNNIYLGHDLYGVNAASEFYYQKEVKDLNIGECAMLAQIANSPANNSPKVDMERALSRQKRILKNMHNLNYISSSQLDEYYEAPLNFKFESRSNSEDFWLFYKDAILDELEKYNLLSKQNLSQGLVIKTNIDSSIMQKLNRIVQKYKQDDGSEVAVVVMKTNSGEVVGMIGGYDYYSNGFNNAIYAKRQVGSTIKPFLYYLGLLIGMTPTTKYVSAPKTFIDEKYGEYKPENPEKKYAHAPITMVQALGVSDNIYAVETLAKIKPKTLSNSLAKLGVKDAISTLAAALGVTEMSPLQNTAIYNTFASQGNYYSPYLVKEVTNSLGEVLLRNSSSKKTYMQKKLVLILNQMMLASFDKNAISYASPTLINYKPEKTFAAKSGTTSFDSWVMGFNTDYTIGIWTGNTANDNDFTKTSLAKGMFVNIANSLTAGESDKWFNRTPTIIAKKIDPLTGENDSTGSIYWFA